MPKKKTTQPKKALTAKKIAQKGAVPKLKVGDVIDCPDCGGSGSASQKYITGAGPTYAPIGREDLRCARCNGFGKLQCVTEAGSLQPYLKQTTIKIKLPPQK